MLAPAVDSEYCNVLSLLLVLLDRDATADGSA